MQWRAAPRGRGGVRCPLGGHGLPSIHAIGNSLQKVTMNLRLITAALAASASLLAVPAQAAAGGSGPVASSDSLSIVFAASYASDCQGPLLGTLGSGAVDNASLATQLNSLAGTTLDAAGRFSANPGDVQWGELFLSAPQTGLFELGLQGGGTYSLYLFNGGATGLGAIEFDNAGITLGLGGAANPLLSLAAIFTSAVPEPGTYAFMLSGLLVLGFLAKHRRAAEPRR